MKKKSTRLINRDEYKLALYAALEQCHLEPADRERLIERYLVDGSDPAIGEKNARKHLAHDAALLTGWRPEHGEEVTPLPGVIFLNAYPNEVYLASGEVSAGQVEKKIPIPPLSYNLAEDREELAQLVDQRLRLSGGSLTYAEAAEIVVREFATR